MVRHSNHVIAVGATQLGDAKASFSNYGNYIDVMAPGDNIYSLVAGAGGSITDYGTKVEHLWPHH